MNSKVCTKCNIEKTIDKYNKNGKKKNGDIRYQNHCNACRKQYNKQYRGGNVSIQQEQLNSKRCTKCNIEKKIDGYNKKGKKKKNDDIRYRSECKACVKQYEKQRYQDNKDKLKCSHEIRKDDCFQCSTQRWKFCSTCEIMRLSQNRLKQKVKVCKGCESLDQKMLRLETKWKEKFISWGYSPSVNDKIIRDYQCKVVNLRRCDFLYINRTRFSVQYIS